MNYQRTCRNAGCYQNSTSSKRMMPRYSSEMANSSRSNSSYNTPTDFRLPVATSLAMVYSPKQVWRDIYEMDCALERGTLFAELDKPLLSAGR